MKRDYFVTGGTGAVGSALIACLLESKENLVRVLIRADSEAQLQQRLKQLLSFLGLDDHHCSARLRIIPVRGDIEKPLFGLSDQSYNEISQQCTHIIHCAGVVRMNLPLEVAKTHAISSTQNIVAFALQCKKYRQLEKIEFVSTVGVGGRMQTAVPETWLKEKREFHNSYETSKAQAEDYLHEQIQQHDLPITVHRPSMVVGHGKTGEIIHFQIFYFICEFISGRRTLGILPSFNDATLDTIPVDYVARVLKWSSENSFCAGKIFHLCSGPDQAIKLNSLKILVRSQFKHKGLPIPGTIIFLPLKVFAQIIRLIMPFLNEKSKKAGKTFPVFLDYLSDRQIFNNEQTTNFIEKHLGPTLPDPTSYLEVVIDYYLKKRSNI